MAHDVFISYSSKDKPTADAVCAALEAKGIRCWIAPRDVVPSVPYGEAIIHAIHDSRLMVLVFSASSNQSPQVMREVERAVSHGKPVLPFRIENVPLSPSMEYFISAPHWLDALTPDTEAHLERLARAAAAVLAESGDSTDPAPAGEPRVREAVPTAAEPIASPTSSVVPPPPTKRPRVTAPVAALLVSVPLLVLGIVLVANRAKPANDGGTATARLSQAQAPVPAAMTSIPTDATSSDEAVPALSSRREANASRSLQGTIGDTLSDGTWRFRVASFKAADSYTMKTTATPIYAATAEFDGKTYRPVAGNVLYVLECRVENAAEEKQSLWRANHDTNTAVLDDQGEFYPPIAYDIQEYEPFHSKPLLSGTGTDFAVLFTVPKDKKPKELRFTLRTIEGNDKGSDVRVALPR